MQQNHRKIETSLKRAKSDNIPSSIYLKIYN